MQAIDRLMEIYMERLTELTALARSIVRSAEEAEDVLQDVMVKLLSAPERLSAVRNYHAFLRTCVRHEAIDHVRRAGREVPTDDTVLDYVRSNLSDREYREVEALLWVRSCLKGLPKETAEAFAAYALDGRSIKELAEELGIPADTLRKRFDRIKAGMRKDLTLFMLVIMSFK